MSIINTALIGKLKKTKADKTNVLELDNVVSFSPSLDYHPATKKYVDDAVLGLSPDTNTHISSGAVSGNTLTITLNDASTVDIDVSSLLDDTTNTLSSGVLNGNVITFTREDSTTFDVDVTNLYDDTNLVTSVNGQTGAVSLNLNDINDVVSLSPKDGEVLTWDAGNFAWIPTALPTDANTYVASGAISGSTLTLTNNDASTVDIDVSSLIDDTNLITSVNGNIGDITVQDVLVSGTNIKTINGISLLGSGNIDIQGGSVTGTVYSASLTVPTSPSAGQIWFNQETGQTFQYNTDADGTQFWLELGGAAFTDTQYTLNESDVITVTDPLVKTYSFNYYVGFVQVFVNRLKLRKSEFTTVADGSSITLNIDLDVGDEIEIVTLDVVQG